MLMHQKHVHITVNIGGKWQECEPCVAFESQWRALLQASNGYEFQDLETVFSQAVRLKIKILFKRLSLSENRYKPLILIIYL